MIIIIAPQNVYHTKSVNMNLDMQTGCQIMFVEIVRADSIGFRIDSCRKLYK